jgi:hypothetical protein
MSSQAQRTHPLLLLRPAASPAIFLAAGARHLTVDRPSQAPSDQICPTTVIPYPARALPPLHHHRTRKPAENSRRPHRRSGSDRFAPPSPPPSAGSLPLPRARGPAPTALSPRRPPPPPAGGPSGPPARARPRSAGPNPPPAQLAEEISFLFLFPFSFPIFIYMYIY